MNLGKILSSFAKHYKPGHGGFALNKPVNSNGVTEQSYAGVQVPMQNQAGSQFIKNADPQSNYRTRMNAVEGNPLNFIGDMGTKLGGGENGRVEISGGHEQMHDLSQKGMDESKRKLFDVAIKAAQTGQSGDYATDGTFLGDSSGSSGSEVDGGTDWDTWSREVDAGLRTPPFVSSPGWEAARRRRYLPPMATRPRVAPNATGNVPVDPVQAYPAQGQGFDGAYPTEMSPAEIAKPMSGMGAALAKTKGEINRREGKDFRKGGADYDKDHNIKDALRSFGLGALQSLAQADPSKESIGMMLGRGLGGGISGGIGGALDRNADEKMGNKIALGNLYQDYAKQLGVQDAELGIAKKKKDIENIDVDNEIAKGNLDERRRAGDERIKSAARNKLLGLKKFDPNNTVHAEAAKAAGLDPKELEGWDDRNPIEKQVAGTTYRLNRGTGAYEPTNLPVDETKTITDYKVAMPNGEVRTYKVAQKDAANFATQMQALGLRLEQQDRQFTERMKLDEKKFTQAKGEFERVMGLRQEALRTGNAEQAKELAAKLSQMLQSATKAKNDGELDDEQYRILTQLIGDISK